MSDKLECAIELRERQFNFLTEMVKKYNMSDESKAIRCLIDYAIEQKDQEQAIFRQFRCFDC